MQSINEKNNRIYGRQIGLVAMCILPIYKLLEAPSLLATYAKADLLWSALLHFILQGLALWGIIYLCAKSKTTLTVQLEKAFGKGVKMIYAVFCLFYLFLSVLPLLDLEKFVYAVFFDTAPTSFSFTFFFFLSAFLCIKGLKTVGRLGDLALFLFVLPFLALILMSLTEFKFDALLPVFSQPVFATLKGFSCTAPQFADVALLLPLLMNFKYEKGDGAKILTGYGLGGVFTLIFLAVFFGVYSAIAPTVHYAFAKIAQYFPALSTIGRIDLIFVYILCIVLFIYTSLPLQYALHSFCKCIQKTEKTLYSFILNLLVFIFVLYFNKHYNFIYNLFCNNLFPIFWIFGLIAPILLIFLKEKANAKPSQ